MKDRKLYFIIGGIVLALVVIVVGAFVIWPAITSAHGNQATSTPTVSATPTPKGNGTAKILKQYTPEIKDQIAQGLHLTADQLTAQLLAGQTLSAIATAQKVSSTQLQSIIANALQTGLQPAVDGGQLTSQQLSKLVKRYQNNLQLLDRLLGGKATPKASPTPTPTSGQ